MNKATMAYLANILAGDVKPLQSGKLSIAKQQAKWDRDRAIVKAFEQTKKELRATGKYGRGTHQDLRRAAFELVSESSGFGLKASGIKQVVEAPKKPLPGSTFVLPTRNNRK